MRIDPGPFELFFELSRLARNVLSWRRALASGAALFGLLLAATALSAETITFTVEDKSTLSRWGHLHWVFEHEFSHEDPRSTDVLVVETSNEVLEVSWSYVFLKFDKYERWNSLQPGTTYRAIVTGWRIPGLRQYRNIVEILEQDRIRSNQPDT